MVKQSIISDDVSERDVHPESFARLRELYAEAAAQAFASEGELEATACTGCGSDESRTAFDVGPAHFAECSACGSLYVNPRPSAAALVRYETESAAAGFRRSPAYLDDAGPQIQRASGHRAEWIAQVQRAFAGRVSGNVIEVGARHPYLREALREVGVTEHRAVAPYGSNSPDGVTSLRDIEAGSARTVVALDVLERASKVAPIITDAHRALAPGGLFVATLRAGSGFDVALLGAAASIHPLEHLNLLSVEGVRTVLERAGFELIELSTPGHLDAERVARAIENGEGDVPRFFRYLFERRDEDAVEGLQRFLQTHLLSSHLRVVARKSTRLSHAP